MPPESLDWAALDRLRATFLDGTAGARDYWQSAGDLASYDRTFAQRIGWKWDHVLEQLSLLKWSPPGGVLLDWGCGSGIAGRAFLDHFGPSSVAAHALSDRSMLAVQFAARRATAKYPGLKVRTDNAEESPGVLLLSHVLTELDDAQLDKLIALTGCAQAVIWVEPGTFVAGQRLVTVRERLRGQFHLVAPCPHQGACGLLAPGNERHWCHHFATPPREIFQDGDWSRFALLAGVDLRSLPLSYLVLDRRATAPMPAGAFRLLGRPRVEKPHALLLGCDASGVFDRKVARRDQPEAYRLLKKGEHDSLVQLPATVVKPGTGSRD